VPVGAARLLARRAAWSGADRLRAALRPARLPGRGRGVRGLAPRRQDAASADQETQRSLRACERDRRLRPRHGHEGQPRTRARERGRLDQRAKSAAAEEARRRRGAPAVALRPAEPGRDRVRSVSGRAAGRLPHPLVAVERARKRDDLLAATERALAEIQTRVAQGTLQGEARIGLAVGEVWNRWRVRKHFQIEVADAAFSFARKTEQIAAEAALDGIYVLRTSVPNTDLEAADVVRAYKQLKEVERAFRTLKGPLELRPIHHRLEDRVKAHVLLCMLSYYLAWHLRQAWKPLLFDDEQPPDQPDPVAKAHRSPQAEQKARSKRTTSGERCHSLATLLDELATRTQNTICLHDDASFQQLIQPTPTQTHALTLIDNYPLTT
jgi:Transposase DDE domain